MNISSDVSLVGFNLSDQLNSKYEKYDLIFKLELNNMYSNKISCVCVSLEGIENV